MGRCNGAAEGEPDECARRYARWRRCCCGALSAGSAALADGGPAVDCAKADFEAVVNEAGAALRDLNRQNTPVFQGKLRELKDKRSWGNDQFLKQAEPFVRDETVAATTRNRRNC